MCHICACGYVSCHHNVIVTCHCMSNVPQLGVWQLVTCHLHVSVTCHNQPCQMCHNCTNSSWQELCHIACHIMYLGTLRAIWLDHVTSSFATCNLFTWLHVLPHGTFKQPTSRDTLMTKCHFLSHLVSLWNVQCCYSSSKWTELNCTALQTTCHFTWYQSTQESKYIPVSGVPSTRYCLWYLYIYILLVYFMITSTAV